MGIAADTPRARKIAETRAEIAELLREDQFQSDRSIAEAVGAGHGLVAKVRREMTDSDGLIRPASRWRREDLPRSAEEVAELKQRDLDDCVAEIGGLMDRIEELEAENVRLRRRLGELEGAAA